MNSKRFWFIGMIISGLVFFATTIFFVYSTYYVLESDTDTSETIIDSSIPLEPIEIPHEDIQEYVPEPTPPPESPKRSARIKAVGDMMLDRTVYTHTLKAGDFNHPFALISYLLQDADLTVGNLEGAITDFTSIANGTGGQRFYFTFSPKFVAPLTQYFDVVSFANNHTLNFGVEGLLQSRAYFDESGLAYFGSPNNNVDNLSVIVEKNGISFGFVGFHELVGYGFDDVLTEVKRLRPDVDVLIVYPHWGAEYITTNPTSAQTREGHALIDAGVDMVIGTHPHVIQPIEIYKNKVIFYSLGNFIFDQYFSEETQQGLALDIDVTENENNSFDFIYHIIPIRVNEKSQPHIADEEETKLILEQLARYSIVTSTLVISINNGVIDL